MKLNLKLVAAAALLSLGLQAQNSETPRRSCGTPPPSAEWDAWFNQKVDELKQARAAGKAQTVIYTIPVVVHVIHGGQAVGTFPNLSQAQVNSQIAVLNADYSGTGFNVGNLAATGFSAVGAADCGIAFCLAQQDPNGNTLTEPGIDRVSYVAQSWTNPASITSQNSFQSYIDGTVKPATIWDPTRYFNIWITDVNTNVGLLGYATFPPSSGLTGLPSGGTISTDGIWVWSRSFGNVGTLQVPYHKGRTASHEAGHWLGLRHIGGDSNPPSCSSNDYCNDTPPQKGGYGGGQYGQNFGAPAYPLYATGSNSCSAAPYGNMFMNFMDYVDDPSCYMFTPDQATRMAVAMANSPYRSGLNNSAATLCSQQAVAPTASFSMASQTCADSLVITNNQSTGTPVPSYSWSAQPLMPGVSFSPNSVVATPTISFMTPATYTITMVATNAAGSVTTTQVILVNDCESSTVGFARTAILDKSITLAPNPSSGIVNISSTLGGNLDVTVNNYLGQYITSASFKDVNLHSQSIDMSNYANGVYFVTLSNGSTKVVKRLIVNK